MFQTPNLPFIISKASLSIEEDANGVEHRVADLTLVIDNLTYELAAEMDADLLEHLYTPDRKIRRELKQTKLDPHAGLQRVTVSLSAAAEETAAVIAEIKSAQITDFSAQKKVDKYGTEWIKATLVLRIDLAERKIREFLFFHFGTVRRFTFLPEQGDILAIDAQQIAEHMGARLPAGVDSVTVTTASGSATVAKKTH